jgi:hypothetical protein
MPGSPSPEGRKPGICKTGQLVTREGPEGSNPSPGAHLEEISVCFEAAELLGREFKPWFGSISKGSQLITTFTDPLSVAAVTGGGDGGDSDCCYCVGCCCCSGSSHRT